jgi:hypothetical protein
LRYIESSIIEGMLDWHVHIVYAVPNYPQQNSLLAE